MLCLAVLVALVGLPSLGQSTVGPSYRADHAPCDVDNDCDTLKGEVCWRLYDGCYQGVCMCDPDRQLPDGDGYCRDFKYGNELCGDDDLCLDTMECLNGTCQCPLGDMTEERNFCMLSHHRMLGQTCKPADTCLQRSDDGYTSQDVRCSHAGRCLCTPGYRPDGKSCKKLQAGAKCTLMYECVGGFMCLEGRCRCPHNYLPVAADSKCANVNAIYDLPLGAHCDEINEKRYCATGLICHRCQSERREKCVRYSMSKSKTEKITFPENSSDNLHFSRMAVLLSALVGYTLINRR